MTTRAIIFSNAPYRIRVNHETGVEIHTVRGQYGERNTYSVWVPDRRRSAGMEWFSGDHTLAEARRVATEIVGRMRLAIADAYEAAQAELDDRQEVKVTKELTRALKADTRTIKDWPLPAHEVEEAARLGVTVDPADMLLARLAPPREVCMVPDCGCSGLAHP